MNKSISNKVLITGHRGLVGSACVKFFSEKGWEVIGVDNNNRAKTLGTPQKEGEEFDIRESYRIEELFKEHKFDAIIHAAAQPSHDYSHDHVLEDFFINAYATILLLEATRKYCPEAIFVFVSTDKVYGENMSRDLEGDLFEQDTRYQSRFPFDEKTGLDFVGHRSPFGCSKAAADMYVQEYRNTFGLKTVCFRCGCITGQNHEGTELHGFLAYLAKCIRTGVLYKIFGFNGKQVRDQIHAEDLASAFWHYIQNPKGDVYNMGGGPERSVSILEAIELIEKETGKEAFVQYHEPRPGDRIWDVHDVSKFHKDYPEWDYKYSLENIITDICQKTI